MRVIDIIDKYRPGKNIIVDAFLDSLLVFVLTSLTGSIGSLIDGVIIGQFLGVDSIAAFGLVSPLTFVFVLFGSIISSGSRNRFTKLIGEGKLDEARGIFTLSWLFSVGMPLICMVLIIIFSRQISVLLGASGNAANLLDKTQEYLIGIAIGLPAMNGIRVLNAYMIIDNDKNRTIIATLIMTVANALMDLFVVFVIHGDTFEMGLTTSIGYYISLFVLLLHFTKKDILLKFDFRYIKLEKITEIIKVGLPTGVCRIGNTLRSTLMNNMLSVVATSGAIAAYTVHRSADSLFNPITIGMGDTVAMMAAIFLGEEDREKMKMLLKTSVAATYAYTLLIAIVVFFAAPIFAALYIKNAPDALEYATRAVQCYAIGMPLYGLNVIYQTYLQGIGKSTLSSIAGFLLEGVLLVLSAFVMLPIFKQEAIWIAFPVTQVLMLIIYGIMIALYCHKNKIKRKGFWNKLLLLPDNFDVPDEDKIDKTVDNMDEIMKLSEEVRGFCEAHGCDSKVSHLIRSCIEEFAGYTIRHGFADSNDHSIDLRILKKGDDYIIRMRDNCALLTPQKQLELFSNEDDATRTRLKEIFGMCKDVQYTSILKLNNIIIKI